MWRHIETALADSRDLAAEVARLSAELAAARLDRANAIAAMRAAIGAQRDGEPDPLYYLRDELQASQNAAEDARRGQSWLTTARCAGTRARSAVAACNPWS